MDLARVSSLAGRQVVIIGHPPTEGLIYLIKGLKERGATVFLRDHNAGSDPDGKIVASVRALQEEQAVIKTRAESPASAQLVNVGEFNDAIIVAPDDQGGVMAAIKAVGITYPHMDADAAVLDGPVRGKTKETLSTLGFRFVQAWGALPPLGSPDREEVLGWIVWAFVGTIRGGNPEAEHELDGFRL